MVQGKNMKERSSNYELLRIVCMILIISHHYSVHGEFKFNYSVINLNQFWIQVISLGGKVGVNIFVLITGYFMINSEIKFKRAITIMAEVIFYSLVTLYFLCSLGLANF